MTLVLPASFCGDSNSYGHRHHCGSSMPCVFDSDALDFESALMTDWTSDIGDYDTTEEKAPSATDSKELKRKNAPAEITPQPKKLRRDDQPSPPLLTAPAPPILSAPPPQQQPHRFIAPHHLIQVTPSGHHRPYPHPHHLPPSPLTISHSWVDFVSDQKEEENEDEEEEEEEGEDEEEDEEEFFPRRRVVPQMWNSRQRWKDERKKVLKMSIGKLAEIEDPELWLLRSVLINNTIKKLHLDIRNERQAKLRHRQQRMDYFEQKFQSLSSNESSQLDNPSSDAHQQQQAQEQARKPELYDESSCDEIFGISEDFLRVTIPDRRVSSPLPTAAAESPMDSHRLTDKDQPMDCNNDTASSSSASDGSSSPAPHYSPCDTAFRTDSSASTTAVSATNPSSVVPPSRRHVGPTQCATQFRTTRSDCGADSFPPRVPILDSVVYHSLLASLESS